MHENDELIQALAKLLEHGESSTKSVSPTDLAASCLQTILDQGFEIRPTGESDDGRIEKSNTDDHTSHHAVPKGELPSGDLSNKQLHAWWQRLTQDNQLLNEKLVAQVGERFLRLGEPLVAYDILLRGIEKFPGNVRLRQLLALALARSGAPQAAVGWLNQLVEEGHNDEETLGILARTKKDQWQIESDPNKKQQCLREAARLYQSGYQYALKQNSPDGALYAGINAATMTLLSNDTETARATAANVADICQKKLALQPEYWAQATLGECALIQNDLASAAKHYRAAVILAGQNYADIASTRRNAQIILEHYGNDLKVLSDWFPIPNIALFSGQSIGRLDSSSQSSDSMVEEIKTRLLNIAQEHQIGIGYSSATCGNDLIFVGALRELKSESYLVLPLPVERFLETSVNVDPNRTWVSEFNGAVEFATKTSVVSRFSQSAEPLNYEYANLVMTGLAILHSRMLGAELIPIAIFDSESSKSPPVIGGTSSLVKHWNNLGLNPIVIPLIASNQVGETTDNSEPGNAGKEKTEQHIRAILFADAAGFSELSEKETVLFVSKFMQPIADLVIASGIKIESENSWGDALYYVFENVADAGRVALMINEFVNSADWFELGFRQRLRLRTGLHVGPVYRLMDPVTGKITHTGAHVSRAARIEPIAPPGEVYASEPFAALAAAEQVTEFQCDYVGRTPMPKDYGDYATYHVRRVDSC